MDLENVVIFALSNEPSQIGQPWLITCIKTYKFPKYKRLRTAPFYLIVMIAAAPSVSAAAAAPTVSAAAATSGLGKTNWWKDSKPKQDCLKEKQNPNQLKKALDSQETIQNVSKPKQNCIKEKKNPNQLKKAINGFEMDVAALIRLMKKASWLAWAQKRSNRL